MGMSLALGSWDFTQDQKHQRLRQMPCRTRGVRHIDIPITPPKVREILHEKGVAG